MNATSTPVAQHTPAPWGTAKASYADGDWLIQSAASFAPPWTVNEGTIAAVRNSERAEADAHLIAAAPEMYEALKAVSACELRHDERGRAYLNVPARSLNDLGALITAVIAKAEGR